MDRKETGKLGERLAQEYLNKRGCKILAANYRVGRLGEIDLIAASGDRICFIEVKTRTGNTYGTPAEAVSWKKRQTIRQVAACYLKAHGATDAPVQFDILEIRVTREGKLENIHYLEQAF
jgi:putative endonuclease